MSGNPVIGRPVRPTPGTTTPTTNNDVAIRTRVTNPSYTPAEAAAAGSIRANLAAGLYDRDPAIKSRIVNLLATLDQAASSGGRPPRVPDRNQIGRILNELRRLHAENNTAANAGTVTAAPEHGTNLGPFQVSSGENTGLPERLREVKVAWDYGTTDPGVTGFRLYHEGRAVCETRSAGARAMSCDLALSEGAHNFTLRAFNASGEESADSNTAVLNNVFPPQ